MESHFPVPIIVDEATGVGREGEMILGGIPLSRGALHQGRWFALRSQSGAAFLLEGVPAAWWPDGSVKWLHLCGPVDLAGGCRNEFALEPATECPGRGLDTESVESQTRIRGADWQAEVRGDPLDAFALTHEGVPLLERPGLSAELVFQGPEGQDRRRFSLSFSSGPRVLVQGGQRLVLRLPGVFLGADGKPAAELILFLQFHWDRPEVHVEPVFIYLGRPQTDLVASLALTVHTAFRGEDACYGFANERGLGYWDVVQRIRNDERGGDGPRWPQARLVQLGSSFYVTEKRTGPDSSWTKVLEGHRSQGWCALASGRCGVTAAMRYFWQEYPHSLAALAYVVTAGRSKAWRNRRPLAMGFSQSCLFRYRRHWRVVTLAK